MIWTFARALTILAVTLLCAHPSSAQDEDATLDENKDLLEALGADLRIAVFAEVMPPDEAYAIWQNAEQALTAEQHGDAQNSDTEVGDREAMSIYGGELKDAIANGEMTEEEATEAWEQAMIDIKVFYAEHERNSPGVKLSPGAWQRSMRQSGRMLRMPPPDPGRIRILLRPEFRRRDVAYMRSELELENSIATIIETMLEDYNDDYSARAKTFQEALYQSRRRGSLNKVDSTLARMQGLSLDRDRAAERIGVIQNAEKRQRMFDALDNFESNLGKVRNALQAKRAVILEEGDVPDRATVHRMFAELKSYRDQQHGMTVEQIEAVLPPEKNAQLQLLLHQLRLEQARNDSTMGGMKIDLVLSVEEALDGQELDANTTAVLQESLPLISTSAQSWINATIHREAKGLELATAKLQGDDSRINSTSQGYISALSSEFTALLNLRNAIQNAVLEISESLQARNPSAANRFKQITRQQGFAVQMRQRWCQKALAQSLEMDDLDEEVLLELIAIQEDIAPQIEVMREQAIQQRLQHEPRIARDRIERLRDQQARSNLGILSFQEPNHLEFQRLDEQVERQLLALLGEERFRTLPRRPGTRPEKPQGKDAYGKGKDSEKGVDEKKGTSRGRSGRGKGGGKG
jgi:hypothetical protein